MALLSIVSYNNATNSARTQRADTNILGTRTRRKYEWRSTKCIAGVGPGSSCEPEGEGEKQDCTLYEGTLRMFCVCNPDTNSYRCSWAAKK